MKSFKTKILCFSFLLIGFGSTLLAQEKNNVSTEKKVEKSEDRKAKRAEFQAKLITAQITEINKRLDLDNATSAKFEKLYRNYISEINSYRENFRNNMVKKSNEMSKEDADKYIQQRFDKHKKVIEIKEKHYKQFKTVLDAKQILTVYDIENEMQQKIEREHRQRFEKHKEEHQKKNK